MQEFPQPTDAAEIEERFTALLGYGWKKDFSACIGLTLPRLSQQFTENRVRDVVLAHLEWLEAVPVAKWPPRWATLAARARAKAKKDAKAA